MGQCEPTLTAKYQISLQICLHTRENCEHTEPPERQTNTGTEGLFQVSQARQHPALLITYSNQRFVVPFHIPVSDFLPVSHLCPFFLGEVYGNVFESIFGLEKIIDSISDLLIQVRTSSWAFSPLNVVHSPIPLSALCEARVNSFSPS